jgi:hypothetical protein
MALAHHMLLRFSAMKAKVQWKQQYLILGDDIVIFSKEIYDSYVRVLDGLNIPAKPSESAGYCEFAKRHF